MSIYQDIIIDHYRNPRNFGKIENPSGTVSLHNPLCGDQIEMSIILEKNKVKEARFVGRGCAISLASASMLTDKIKGMKKKGLINLDRDFIIKMLGIELSPNRLKCALLSLEAMKRILNF